MRRKALFIAVLLIAQFALAQERRWTVQTAAFQDYRQAAAQVTELESLGFDAYSEFAMSGGRQYARVRIGCFTGRAAAEAFAKALRDNVTAEAVAQPLSRGAATEACVEWDVGFLKPRSWEVVRVGADVLFRVEAGGQVGYLRHDGRGWQFSHSPPDESSTGQGGASFRQVRVGGLSLVQALLPGGQGVNACVGELLWQSALTAVVERSGSVIACVVEESARGATP